MSLVCPHGSLSRKCDTCDLIAAHVEIERLRAERDAARADKAEAVKTAWRQGYTRASGFVSPRVLDYAWLASDARERLEKARGQ